MVREREPELASAVGRWLATAPTLAAPRALHTASMTAVRGRRQYPRGVAGVRMAVWPAVRPIVRLVAIAAVVAAVLVSSAIVALWAGAALRSEDPRPRLEARWPVPFSYVVPDGSDLTEDGRRDDWVVAWSVGGDHQGQSLDGWGPNPTARYGILIGVGPVWGHSVPGRYVLRRDPAGFLTDLRDRSSVRMGAIVPATVDGHPAYAADVAGTGGADLHFGANTVGLAGNGYALHYPSRLIVTNVDDQPVFIQIWAHDTTSLESWTPTAMQFVDSIRFVDTAP